MICAISNRVELTLEDLLSRVTPRDFHETPILENFHEYKIRKRSDLSREKVDEPQNRPGRDLKKTHTHTYTPFLLSLCT